MLKTLYGKLAAVLFALLALIGLFNILLTLVTSQLYLQEVNQRLHRTLAEHLVSEQPLIKEGEVNEGALQEMFHMLMVINPSIEIYLLDPFGTILAFSAPPGKVKRHRVSLQPIRRFLRHPDRLPILGDDPRSLRRQKIFSVAPVKREGRLEGYLYVVLGGEEYDSIARRLQGSYILRFSITVVLAGLILALGTGLLFFRLLTKRLRTLTAAMETLQQSQFQQPVVMTHRKTAWTDEIDRLALVFSHMAAQILRHIQTLKQMDRHRRELVANISHDLRTPLASLQGYLETLLLKHGKLPPAEERRYLMIALKHSKRLGKLVSELFELAKLDAHETQLHREPFSLGELVQDVVQKFQLVAQKRKVKLRIALVPDLPFVFADIGLIERVLDNLIQNALRHTPAGGVVTVSLRPGPEQVTVQVTDTGSGIPPEEIPFIFDRFYQAKTPHPERSRGTGLGLAIVKRILDLHGSPIEVRSTPDAGTTFTFSLPTASP